MLRRTIACLLVPAAFAIPAGCSGKGGKDVTGPDVPLRLGLVSADVNGHAWTSVDATGKPIAECYLFIMPSGDSLLHLVARRQVGADTLMSAIFMDVLQPRPGTIALHDTSTATWYVQRVSGADTLQGWWGTPALGGSITLTRLNLAADSAYATFAFEGLWGPSDTVRVTNGRFGLAYNVVHVTEPAWAFRPSRARGGVRAGPGNRRAP